MAKLIQEMFQQKSQKNYVVKTKVITQLLGEIKAKTIKVFMYINISYLE